MRPHSVFTSCPLRSLVGALSRAPRLNVPTSHLGCASGPMSKAVVGMLDSLGVDPESIMYDNFGG